MNIGLTMGFSPKLELTVGFLKMSMETSGDIPVYSLYRIRRMLREWPIGIDSDLEKMLIRELLQANAQYKKDSGNDWACLTSNNLVSALEGLRAKVVSIIDRDSVAIPREQRVAAKIIRQALLEACSQRLEIVKQWFSRYYDELLYDMSGKVPWAVVQSLRRGLSIWIVGQSNPFQVDIEEFVLDVGAKNGYSGDSPEDAWQAMGGKLLNRSREDFK
jgi:hypothetical protein